MKMKSEILLLLSMVVIFLVCIMTFASAFFLISQVQIWTGSEDITEIMPSPTPATGEWEPHVGAELSSEWLINTPPERIAETLFNEWLKHYLAPNAEPSYRLETYQINHVEIPSGLQSATQKYQVDLIAKIEFSVKPVSISDSYWIVDNGEVTDEGWVMNKVIYAGIVITEETYFLRIIGINP